MKYSKGFLTVGLLTVSLFSFSQSAQKIKKNLNVLILGTIDTSYSFSFEPENPDKHGFDYVIKNFKEAFMYLGLKVSPLTPTHHYSLIMDYDYGYRISAYKMQYTNLRCRIIDVENPTKPIGTIDYNGRYENTDLSDAIAAKISEVIKDQLAHPAVAKSSQAKSKEERLIELKSLLDKGLITKEDYENQKTKILND